MKTIRSKRALTTATTCGLVPVIHIILESFFNLFSEYVLAILPILSYLLWLLPGVLFFLALVLPNLDMLDKGSAPASAALFYKPLLISAAYYVVAGAGVGLSFMLIFMIPFFLYVAILPVLVILFFYFRAMAKLAMKFLGRENSPYGSTFSYQRFAWCGLLAVAITFGLQMLVPLNMSRTIGGELLTCLGGMAGVGYMFGRVLQGQHDEEQFYLENYPEQALVAHQPNA
ncbi:hypothetical protein [Pontibacter mangrovi]|uniref:Uncharacterized protein n=1 Tax=Pontibacter mangrovi TaxID=2589816 RepID=A0A501W5L1_9BACT|nr:hypothetical protein [Pontibacter mangrovi]TPE44022.1 hypothetical protein FJM65_11415 [Pontibacter mangrovi]